MHVEFEHTMRCQIFLVQSEAEFSLSHSERNWQRNDIEYRRNGNVQESVGVCLELRIVAQHWRARWWKMRLNFEILLIEISLVIKHDDIDDVTTVTSRRWVDDELPTTYFPEIRKVLRSRLRIKVPPTAFRTVTPTLTLTSDLDLQSRESYGHDPYTCKHFCSAATPVRCLSVWKLEWKRTDWRRRLHYLPCWRGWQ